MNLQQLEYIIALDKTQNFSKAAESCYVTQATLSTMIKRLEEELEVVLFDRKSNPIITTDCGKEIVEMAQKTVFYAGQIKNLAQNIKGNIEGKVKVGVIPTIANNLLPIIIKPLLDKYPQLQLDVVEITTDHILKQLKEGMIDVGIISTPFKTGADFEEEILYYEKLLVYGNTHSEKQYLLPKEIIDEKIWLLEEGHCLRDQFINFCSLNKKKSKDNFRFEANSFETLLSMVDNFGGLTLIPELYERMLSIERKDKIQEFTSPYPVREVSLIHYRPFAKLRLTEMLVNEIKALVTPLLKTEELHKSEQVIVKT